VNPDEIVVKGPLGTLTQPIDPRVVVKLEDGKVTFAAANESKAATRFPEPCARTSPTWSRA
jgi:large subunit ribosomal protein L6